MQVRLNTSSGAIVLKLNAEKAPKTVANFISYVKSGFYTDTIFHRVINNFMIQGGGLDASMRQKTGNAPIENEANNGLKNTLGSIAMARTSDPHSASSQFFINVKNNDFLNYSSPTPQGWGYCVFGEVVEGMEVVNAIKAVPTTNRAGQQDVPVEEIKILSAEVIEEA
ncbi:MAG: peptidyl-prolyl cis-trans isomerase [Pseudomonadota bacterium]|jgi:peptidyl-prolyl cis-trans isomerase B (cyclophilin B)